MDDRDRPPAREDDDTTVGGSGFTPSDPGRGAFRAAIACFAVATISGIGAAWAYAADGSDRLLGVCLALALSGIGFGLAMWARSLDLDEHVVQAREPLRTTTDERAEFGEIIDETVATVGRRRILTVLLGTSAAGLAVGFFGPIGSLGPKPGSALTTTAWRSGRRLVSGEGAPIARFDSGGFGQLATVFPEGFVGRDDSQVILLRLPPDTLSERTIANGTIDGWVAYSKICTHAGCSVGLFGVDDRPPDILRQLVCPCHQSVFDPTDAAKPIGGPAPRPLPQLPLGVDDNGFLIATSDFPGPVGPITWTGQ
jgi:ubiquinol-cytochrome c reductase iron-sulfur subunit